MIHTYICVFFLLSLNAKLVGRLYESLAPAEGEVRGCISCLPLCVALYSCMDFYFFFPIK